MYLSYINSTIPKVTFEGAAQVQTVDVAASFYCREFEPRYIGRNLLRRVVDLRPISTDLPISIYRDRHLVTRLESVLTEKGRASVSLARISSLAYHEALNHKDEPELQRLVLLENAADLAIDSLRYLAATDNEGLNGYYNSVQGFDNIAIAKDLVAEIDEITSKPAVT